MNFVKRQFSDGGAVGVRSEGVVPISRNGRTVAFLVSRDKLAALMETMELQKDAGLMELIRKDKAGKVRFTAVPDEM